MERQKEIEDTDIEVEKIWNKMLADWFIGLHQVSRELKELDRVEARITEHESGETRVQKAKNK